MGIEIPISIPIDPGSRGVDGGEGARHDAERGKRRDQVRQENEQVARALDSTPPPAQPPKVDSGKAVERPTQIVKDGDRAEGQARDTGRQAAGKQEVGEGHLAANKAAAASDLQNKAASFRNIIEQPDIGQRGQTGVPGATPQAPQAAAGPSQTGIRKDGGEGRSDQGAEAKGEPGVKTDGTPTPKSVAARPEGKGEAPRGASSKTPDGVAKSEPKTAEGEVAKAGPDVGTPRTLADLQGGRPVAKPAVTLGERREVGKPAPQVAPAVAAAPQGPGAPTPKTEGFFTRLAKALAKITSSPKAPPAQTASAKPTAAAKGGEAPKGEATVATHDVAQTEGGKTQEPESPIRTLLTSADETATKAMEQFLAKALAFGREINHGGRPVIIPGNPQLAQMAKSKIADSKFEVADSGREGEGGSGEGKVASDLGYKTLRHRQQRFA